MRNLSQMKWVYFCTSFHLEAASKRKVHITQQMYSNCWTQVTNWIESKKKMKNCLRASIWQTFKKLISLFQIIQTTESDDNQQTSKQAITFDLWNSFLFTSSLYFILNILFMLVALVTSLLNFVPSFSCKRLITTLSVGCCLLFVQNLLWLLAACGCLYVGCVGAVCCVCCWGTAYGCGCGICIPPAFPTTTLCWLSLTVGLTVSFGAAWWPIAATSSKNMPE